jgi:hypothetical protein
MKVLKKTDRSKQMPQSFAIELLELTIDDIHYASA